MAMKLSKSRLPDSFSDLVNFLVAGTGTGLNILVNSFNKTVTFSLKYVNKNLKINSNNELDTIQDISKTDSPEFAGLKLGNSTGLLGRVSGNLGDVLIGDGLALTDNTLSVTSSAESGNYLEVITPIALKKGDVVYLNAFPDFIGFSSDDYEENTTALVQISGEVTLTDTLIPGNYYYISNEEPKKLTNIVPYSGYLIKVGIATSTNKLLIQNVLKIKL